MTELVRLSGDYSVGVQLKLADGSTFVVPAVVQITAAGIEAGGTGGLRINEAGQVEVVQPDDFKAVELDLTRTGETVEMTITSGQGVVAADIVGLKDSGATIMVERTVGGLWSQRNLLVVGTAGAFANGVSTDASLTINTVGSRRIRFRVAVAGTGTAKIYANATVNSSLIQMATTLPPGNNRIGSFTPVDAQGVPIAFWPETQAVSGKFWPDLQPVSMSAAANFEPTRVNVTTATQRLVVARSGRRQVSIIPTSNFLFYVGPTAAKATAAAGVPIANGAVVTFEYSGELFVTGANNGTVDVVELF